MLLAQLNSKSLDLQGKGMANGKLEEVIDKAWASIRDRVESKRDLDFDHEFTLQFHLAWEVARLFSFSDSLNVRFEFPCGKDTDGETIRLDLLLWTDPEAKVAVELKAPVRSETGKNSAMTQFRMRFYRDIHRLRHLVTSRHSGIRLGVLLAVVNERGYVVERFQRVNRERYGLGGLGGHSTFHASARGDVARCGRSAWRSIY